MANRLNVGFNKNEVVQVTENYIDKKTQQELIELMNAMFDERARALRQFMFELLSQKAAELQDLNNEFDPQREMVRKKRDKGFMTDLEFMGAMDRLNSEQQERQMDIEIMFADKENALKEELNKI